MSVDVPTNHGASEKAFAWRSLATGEWIVKYTNAQQRRLLHYWFTILWLTAGVLLWIVLRNDLWWEWQRPGDRPPARHRADRRARPP